MMFYAHKICSEAFQTQNHSKLQRTESEFLVTLDKDLARLYLLEPEATVVLIDIHPPFPADVVGVFARLLKVKDILENLGLVVVGKKMVRKIKL